MPTVTYIEFDGTAHTVEAADGTTLMQTSKPGQWIFICSNCARKSPS